MFRIYIYAKFSIYETITQSYKLIQFNSSHVKPYVIAVMNEADGDNNHIV